MPIVKTSLTLDDLPAAPEGKQGWPWTESILPLSHTMPNGCEWPLISIVTPSYNQGQFLEETIRSVLLQGYPNIEYIIIDGGSTDNSVDIIKKYEQHLTYWVSEPDRGQSNALNKGFRRVTGQLIGWQNSDDYYHPTSFVNAAQASVLLKDIDIIYGSVNCVDQDRKFLKVGYVSQFNYQEMLPWANMFNQSMFFRDKIFKEENFINEHFQHFMDYDFFWRLAVKGYKFHCVPEINAYFRFHLNSKGYYQPDIVGREYLEICKLIYNQENIPDTVKSKAIECFRSFCLDFYGKSNLPIFRWSVQELVSLAGIQSLSIEIVFKYLISLLGLRNVEFLRKSKSMFTIKNAR
ncbi:glycosyltransferase family 2 protein [Oscillatoria amoena NRMC-F 0135]|nr:glycosyltransferase family 2 protein [Geitlerinema splendidum]MDL5046853.1 glycosyltransferase family 2 protein [Oscillatoria amoena NRMC-F 0135]